jgi:hypothetical protein
MADNDDVQTIVPGTKKSSKSQVLARIGDLRKSVVEELDHVTLQLNPIQEVTARAQASQALPPPVTAFGYTLTSTAVLLSWAAPVPIGSTVFYEIRKGISWDTGTFVLRTPSLSAALDPVTVGEHNYMIKTLNGLGDESTTHVAVVVTVPALGTPSVQAQVIDNNVQLSWTEPSSSFTVDYYKIYKDSVQIGELSGLFISIFETVSATYTYGVVAVDIAGNESPEGQVAATVDQPPDFELLANVQIDLSSGTATHSNTYYEDNDGKVYGPVNLTETFEDHFTTAPAGSGGPWASPQEQVDDGQSVFIQENVATGYFQGDEHDLGSTVNNVIANVSVVTETVDTTTAPTFTVAIRGGTSPGVGSFVNGNSQFFTAVRYLTVKVTIDANGAALDSMGLSISVDVKYAIDGNVMVCDGTDAAGTPVYFPRHGSYTSPADGHATKNFSDIDSITLAPIETDNHAITAIYDFTDAPDPSEFKILCFDNAGKRVDATVSWKVRGIRT